ncbi:MAG: glycosyltransferase [Patescibacteria group bacterium]|nr:glycosyltransferase [Patescibacteria group bacterium]
MKICIINNLYGPLAKGGAEKVVATLARGLQDAGHEVFIITTKPRAKQLKIDDDELRIYYLNSLYFNLGKLPKIIRFFWQLGNIFNIVNYFKVKKILRREKCDAVITNNLMGIGFLTPLAIRKLKIKHLHIMHDIQLIHPAGLILYGQEKIVDRLFARNYAGLTSRLFASPQIAIFPSGWLLNIHLDKIFFIKSKRIVMPNPIAPVSAARKPASGIFKFLYLGQIERHKGVDPLIQAFIKIKEKFPLTELAVAGDGAELERLKIAAGEKSGIKFLGRRSKAQVDELLKSSHALVVPTLCYENCPTVILEAFSAGLPVLAADLGGISELLGENAGILFRPGNVANLAEKMEWMLENQDSLEEMAKAGKEKAAQSGVENYIKKLEELLK